MTIAGSIEVACPACGRTSTCEVVQSINAAMHPKAKAKLLAGDLNVLACDCGRRTLLAATLLYHDPDKNFYCQVVTGGEEDMWKAASLMKASGATGTLRLVPSPNALIEKVKIVDADLHDWAVEMAKVLLLASVDASDLDRVLLFDRVDDDKIRWVLFDGARPEAAASAKSAYDKLAGREASAPKADELRIDRAWAVAAVQALIAEQN